MSNISRDCTNVASVWIMDDWRCIMGNVRSEEAVSQWFTAVTGIIITGAGNYRATVRNKSSPCCSFLLLLINSRRNTRVCARPCVSRLFCVLMQQKWDGRDVEMRRVIFLFPQLLGICDVQVYLEFIYSLSWCTVTSFALMPSPLHVNFC